MEATIPHIELDCILIDSATQVRGFKSGATNRAACMRWSAATSARRCGSSWTRRRATARGVPAAGRRIRRRNSSGSSSRRTARRPRGPAALLAKKRDESAAFAELDHVSELERAVDESGIDDREYLEASGIDADAVDEAGARAEGASRTRGVGVRSSATRWRPSTSRPRRTSWRTRATTVSPPRRPERS